MAELEQALSLRAGTVSTPASRWSHRPGTSRRHSSGGLRALPPRPTEVALACGCMLPPHAAASPSLAARPPAPVAALPVLSLPAPPSFAIAGHVGDAVAERRSKPDGTLGFDVGDAVADLLSSPDPLPAVLAGAVERDG